MSGAMFIAAAWPTLGSLGSRYDRAGWWWSANCLWMSPVLAAPGFSLLPGGAWLFVFMWAGAFQNFVTGLGSADHLGTVVWEPSHLATVR
jgi:hypothetical protein